MELIGVEIQDMDDERGSYVAATESDCRDEVDAMVYRLAVREREVVHMGHTSGIPLFKQ